MPRTLASARRSARLAVLLALAGCATSGRTLHLERPSTPLRAVAVRPARLRYAAEPFEVERRTADVTAALWSRTGWLIFEPGEIHVLDETERDPIRGTDLLLVARQHGLEASEVASLEITLSLREARGRALVTGHGLRATAGDQVTHAVVQLGIVAAGGRTLAEIELVHEVDPFAPRPDWDQRPWVREAVDRAVDVLIEAIDDGVRPTPARPDLPIGAGRPSLSAILGPVPGLEPGAARLGGDEGPDAEAQLLSWRVAQYFDPGIELTDALRLRSRPPGDCLGPEVPPPWRPDDCLVGVDGASVASLHALRRRLALSTRPVRVTVLGGDGRERWFDLEPR